MFWQKELLRARVGISLNDTYILGLPDFGLLNGLLIRLEGNMVSGLGIDGGDWRLIDFISKIEVILNGALVCKSIKGDMAQALSFYDDRVLAPDTYRNFQTDMNFTYIMLNFGRKMFDKQVGLDLSKFKSVELKITNTATASEFSAITISVIGTFAREHDTAFTHYMRSEEWRKWTTVQNEIKYLEIPSQHVVRRIILQAKPELNSDNVEKTNMWNLMYDVDLSLRSGMTRMYKGGLDDIMVMNLHTYGRNLVFGGHPFMNADKGINMGLGRVIMSAHGASKKDDTVAATIATMEASNNVATQKPETNEAAAPIALMVGGMAYHNTAVLEFDVDPDIETWIDPEKEATVKLDILTKDSGSAANGTNKVILDRLVQHPSG